MITADVGETNAQGAVIATRPASIPLQAIVMSGLLNRKYQMSMAAAEPATAAVKTLVAVTACPTSARAQLNVARAYEALGDRGQAMDYYKRAIQSAPSDHDAAPGVSEQAQQALARLTAR